MHLSVNVKVNAIFRRLGQFVWSGLGRFVLILAMLSLPWPGLGRAYTRMVTSLLQLTLAGDPAAPIRWTFGPSSKEEWHLRAHAEDTSTGRFVETDLDVRRAGYLACAVFVALALATPLRASKKIGTMLFGLALLQMLPALPLLSFFSGKLPVQAFHLHEVERWLVELAYHSLIAAPGMAYAAPALLWVALVWLIDTNVFGQPWLRIRNEKATDGFPARLRRPTNQ